MLNWSKASLTFVLPMVWLAGCASSSPRQSVTIAGGQTLPLQRQGTGFKQAENERITITDAGLQAVNLNGNPTLCVDATASISAPANVETRALRRPCSGRRTVRWHQPPRY